MKRECLSNEKDYFESRLPELLENYEGKYALVHDQETIDIFDTKTEALREGYRRFHRGAFLVKRIQASDRGLSFLSNIALPAEECRP